MISNYIIKMYCAALIKALNQYKMKMHKTHDFKQMELVFLFTIIIILFLLKLKGLLDEFQFISI